MTKVLTSIHVVRYAPPIAVAAFYAGAGVERVSNEFTEEAFVNENLLFYGHDFRLVLDRCAVRLV